MNRLRRSVLTSGGLLIGSNIISNFINFAYNAYLGRSLGFNDFALITLANSIWYLFNFWIAAFSVTVNHRVAYLTARAGHSEGIHFYQYLRKLMVPIVVVLSIGWLLAAAWIAHFFQLSNPFLIFSFTPIIAMGAYLGLYKGVLHGRFLFHFVALSNFLEAVIKLAAALVLLKLGHPDLVYLSIPASIVAGFILSFLFVKFTLPPEITPQKHAFHFPRGFFFASIMTGLSATAFLTLDVIMTKHYFHPNVAGVYALLSLSGKMIFFFGSLFTVFTVPFTSRDEGSHRDPNRGFYFIFSLSFLLTALVTIAIGPLGGFILPILFGPKIFAVVPYLTRYALAIGLYTLADAIVAYHLAKKQYLFPAIALFFTIVMCVGIALFHRGIQDVVTVILFTSIANFGVLVPLHFLQRNGGFMIKNILEFFYLFSEKFNAKPTKPGGKRILIYNWRDTRHDFAGGAEVYIQELGKRWAKAGNSVTIFCGNDGMTPRHEYIDGIHIVRRGGFYTVYFWAFVYYVLRFHNKFDVIIDSENGIPFFTPFYARQQIFLLMHHVHQDVFRKNLLPPWSWIAGFMEGKLMPFVYRNRQIITVSPSSKADIIKHKLSNIEPLIVYNGIYLKTYKPSKKSAVPMILYVGRLKYYKRINIFIKAAREILKTVPDAQFIIAGGGEEDEHLIPYTKRIGMDKHIVFTGKISEAEKIALYQKAWVFVNPSSMEGWGITSIEANACGTPIVAADVPGLRDSVKEGYNGFRIRSASEYDFAAAILKLVKNTNLREMMAKNAVEWASHFSWEKSTELGYKIIANKEKHANRPLQITGEYPEA
ncbi:glycosyltransferase [Candidatus Microgenomates bacterium]|nr:glycosyltransferase [Candidatus Microgenomates bacterium]